MREIKFRAWSGDLGSFICPSRDTTLALHGDGHLIQFWRSGSIVDEQPVHRLDQFTGLKDKNGTDIYEGDICTYNKQPPQEVFWLCGGFCTDTLTITDYWSNECEVIGNIHENSELLK